MRSMKWAVRKRDNRWQLYDTKGSHFDSFDTLPEAHTMATRYAIAEIVFQPGGLTRFKALMGMAGEYLAEMVRRMDDPA